jgi:hypothetical protein
MRNIVLYLSSGLLALVLVSCAGRSVSGARGRVVSVAQSGAADVIGNDSAALQKAAGLLQPGDTLSIEPGTYEMDNSLFVPSGVTVRGVAGKTILRKSRGVESALAEDGDYGESALMLAEPEAFRPGMGIAVLDDAQNSGWDIRFLSLHS